MRLLQWFYADVLEIAERIDVDATKIGIVETSVIVKLVRSSDTFSLDLIAAAAQLPLDITQLASSDSLTIGFIDDRVLMPIDPPVGTGEVEIGLGEKYSLFITHHTPLSDSVAVGVVTANVIFQGEFVPPSDIDAIAIGIVDIRRPTVVAVHVVDSFALNLATGRKSAISFMASESVTVQSLEDTFIDALISSQYSIQIGWNEGWIIHTSYRRLDSLVMGLAEDRFLQTILSRSGVVSFGVSDLSVIFTAPTSLDTLLLGWNESGDTLLRIRNADTFRIYTDESSVRIYYAIVNNGDVFRIALVESTGEDQLDITIIPEDLSLAGFPGLQATWEEDPYMDLVL